MALSGIKVLELAGLAPSTMCGMLLLDYGAEVLRIDRVKSSFQYDVLGAGKRSIALDLKKQAGKDIFLRLCKTSDVLIDPFRPGVLESLELSPARLQEENTGIIIARLSGYGQTGPLAQAAGHDINYLAMSGVLSMLGKHPAPPTPPVNLLADFAGGSLLCAYCILAAVIQRAQTGQGKVIDFSLSEGSAYVSSWLFRSRAHEDMSSYVWAQADKRGHNLLDGGHPLYRCYETADAGKFMAVGALEPQFAQAFLERFGCPDLTIQDIMQSPSRAMLRMEEHFKTKTRQEWTQIFAGSDACATPVLTTEEAASHPHNVHRKAFRQDSPTLRTKQDSFQSGPKVAPSPIGTTDSTPMPDGGVKKMGKEPCAGENSEQVLLDLGFDNAEIESFAADGVIELANDSVGNSKL